MKTGIINSSQLVNCWNAEQISKCVGCPRYATCAYTTRQHDEVYDKLLSARKHYNTLLRRTDKQLRYYESHRTLDGLYIDPVK